VSTNEELIREARHFASLGSDLNSVEADRFINELASALEQTTRELERMDEAFDRDLPWRYDEVIEARDAAVERAERAEATLAKVREYLVAIKNSPGLGNSGHHERWIREATDLIDLSASRPAPIEAETQDEDEYRVLRDAADHLRREEYHLYADRVTIAAEDLKALRRIVDEQEAREAEPIEAGEPECDEHAPVQHRDGREPWCKKCGLTKAGRKPVSRLGRRPMTREATPKAGKHGPLESARRLRFAAEAETNADVKAAMLAGSAALEASVPLAEPIEAGEREALTAIMYDAWNEEDGNSIPFLSSEARLSLADAILDAGFRREPVEDAESVRADVRMWAERFIPGDRWDTEDMHDLNAALSGIVESSPTAHDRRREVEDAEPMSQYEKAMRERGEWVDAEHEDAEPVAYELRYRDSGRLYFTIPVENISDRDRAEFDLIPLYRHPSAPIEVTDEALVTAMNVANGYEPPVTDIAYWSEGYRENIRAGIEAALREMGKSNG